MIDKINKYDDGLLNCKLYYKDKIITGYQVLDLCIETIKKFNGEYCYYMNVVNDNPNLIYFEPHQDDIFCCAFNGTHLCVLLFNALCYLELLTNKDNYVRWSK